MDAEPLDQLALVDRLVRSGFVVIGASTAGDDQLVHPSIQVAGSLYVNDGRLFATVDLAVWLASLAPASGEHWISDGGLFWTGPELPPLLAAIAERHPPRRAADA